MLSCKTAKQRKRKKIFLKEEDFSIYVIYSTTLRHAWDGSRRKQARGATSVKSWIATLKGSGQKAPGLTFFYLPFFFFVSILFFELDAYLNKSGDLVWGSSC